MIMQKAPILDIEAKIDELKIAMEERMATNIKKIIESGDLNFVKWITRNPGRQWTSSINPVVKDPRDWYGDVYRSFPTGLHDREVSMRFVYKRSTLWKVITRDIFNIVLKKFAMKMCNYH
jgi:hypothetical protein